MLLDPSRRKVGKAGRRGGKTVWEVAEVAVTCHDDGGRCGWAAPNFPILRDAWREIKHELAGAIREVRESEWTIHFNSGGMLECWSMDAGIIARGRKYHKFIIDEAGLVPNLGTRFRLEIEPTLGDYNGVLVAGSTPNGVSPDFSKWFKQGQNPGSGWKSWQWTSLDNPAVAENMARLIEAARADGVPEWIIQQEYLAQESEDETGFFQRSLIDRLRQDTRPPIAVGRFTFEVEDIFEREHLVMNRKVDRLKWVDDPYGPWKFWTWWDGRRPPQDATGSAFAAGLDLSWGVGASNTVAAVGNSDTRELIAEYVDPNVTPEQAALEIAPVAYWLGGRPGAMLPMLGFEANGPGESFTIAIQKLRYGNLVREKRAPTAVGSDDPGRVGWRSSLNAKRTMLELYRAALATGRYLNYSEPALDECLTYHMDGKGRVLSEREWIGSDTEDLARAPHGDRVIAHALCRDAMDRVSRNKPSEHPPIPGTLSGYLHAERMKREKARRW